MTIDAIDRKIIALLQTDSRLTLQEIADQVGLTASPCHRRIGRLEHDGIITRYSAMVDQKPLVCLCLFSYPLNLKGKKKRSSSSSQMQSRNGQKWLNAI